MIKTIIFDLGNVTINFDETPTFNRWSSSGNKPLSEVKRYHQQSPAKKAFERGEITPEQFYKRYANDLNLKINYKSFVENYCDIFIRNREVEEIIKSLKGRYKLIALSNTNVLQYEYVKKRYKILDMFDEQVLSYKEGMRKPNPGIFMKAVQKAGALPWNCAYFDDMPQFVWAARMLGIRAFQYRDVEKLKKDLKKVL